MKQSRRQAIKADRNYRMKTELGRKRMDEDKKEREKSKNGKGQEIRFNVTQQTFR